MGAEVGATTSAFPYTKNMGAYLRATGRAPVAVAADRASRSGYLSADEGVEYDEVIEVVRDIISTCRTLWFIAVINLPSTLRTSRLRTYPNLSRQLTDHLLPIYQRPSPSLPNLSKNMVGKMKSQPA